MGLVTQVADLHGGPTDAAYDAFGRLSSLTRPSPYLSDDGLPTLSDLPSVKIEYFLPADWTKTPYSIVHTMTQDGADHDIDAYQHAWGYVDGVGRTLMTLSEADPNAGDGGDFVANGLVDYDRKGAPRRAFLSFFFSGDPAKFPLGTTPASLYGSQRYDAFGRQLETFGLDGTLTLRSVYHALSQDKWDAADVAPGPHQGTPASVATDGHGRGTVITERIHSGAAIEARETRTSYLPTGEVETVTRHRVNGADPDIVRWMQYDSLGRRVLNAEPNVTKNFHLSPTAPIGTMRAWRYAYNDAGDLVGTSDARGCGANYGYDAAGRIIFEDYSPCTAEQEDYSHPNIAGRSGIEVLYHYDDIDPADAPASTDFPVVSSLYLGRLAWVADRAARTLTRYDGRGRATGVARRVARPGPPALALADRYAPRWYVRKANFDAADRPIRESTGASVSELVGAAVPAIHEGHDATRVAGDNASVVTTAYTARGMVKRVGGSYGDLVGSVVHDADGLVTETRYADVATTTTSFSYDNRRRLRSVQTYRGPPGIWSQPPPAYQPAPSFGASAPTTFQLLLQDEDFEYDAVDNPTEIRDWRLIDEWPAGAKPVTQKIQYDDLYRVTQVDHQYAGGDDAWTSPFAAENAGEIDPRRAAPSPHVSFDKRVLRQTFQYDWLGNTSKTTDDANGFYDRSLGAITNDVTSGKPYQLKAASNEATAASSPRRGHLSAAYDDAGNLVRLAVVRQGTCLPSGANCSHLFAYDWDEVGRLVDARRWDVDATTAATLTASSPLPAPAPVAHLRHRYDSSDQRVIKTASDDETLLERSTLYIFGSLELRGAIPTVDGDYERASLTEVPYLMAHAVRLGRVVFEPAQVPVLDAGKTHVFLDLGDHLGSTSVVLDKSTSELVERSTYEAYGAAESDYRPARWAAFREDYRFTGKEEDVEVGLQYFGARFFSPALGRWASADPLAVQGPKGDLNLYAYVSGQPLKATDPVGLDKVVERFEATNATVTYTLQDGGFLYDKSVGEEGTMYNVEFQTDKLTSAGIRPAAPSPAPMGKAAAPTPVATAEERWQAAKAGAQNWYLDQAKNGLNMLAGSTGNPLALLGGKALSLGVDRLQAPEPTAEPGSFRDYQLRGSYDFMQGGATFLATTVPLAAGGFGLGAGAPGFSLSRGAAGAAAEGALAAEEGFALRSLPGSAGMQVPGRLSPAQLTTLTEEHGVEFSLVYRTGPGPNGGGGTYWLHSGTSNQVMVPLGQDIRWIYHTHPGGTAYASSADRQVLQLLQQVGSPQRSSQVIPVGGGPIRFSF